jgi:hypothetical protein
MIIERQEDTTADYRIRILRWLTPVAVACVLLLIQGTTGLAGPSGRQVDTTLSIAPASQKVAMGNTVTTDVMVEDVANLYTFEFELSFDPALVEGVQVEPGGFLSPDWELQNTIDNDDGLLIYALSQLNPTEPVTGSGALATITWRGVATGTSPITLTHQELYHPGGGAPISATIQNGEIVVGEAPSEFVFLPMVSRQ